MEFSDAVRSVRQYGALNTLTDFGLRAANRVVFFKILKCIKIDKVNAEFLKCDDRFRGAFLDRATLTEFTKTPEYELSKEFLDKAFAKGDECYGFLDGNRLAAYGWYSNKPTEIGERGLILSFDPRYIYMYKGFTHTDYRGKRLHAVGMTRALEELMARGYKGLVSNVEWSNFASLRSCYRMGYEDVGNIYALGANGHYILQSGPACQKYGLRLEQEKRYPREHRRAPAV